VQGVVQSAFGYAGQKCSACSRAIVVRGAYDEFCRRLKGAVESLVVGPAEDPGTFVGPVIDPEARARIQAAIAKGEQAGRLLAVGRIPEGLGLGYYVAPHVFADVAPNSPLAQEEIFGPVLAVLPAESFEQALELANGTRFALTGGVYSRSPVNLKLARQRFEVGNLYLNRSITGAMVQRHPFGGYKLSGIGSKAGGPDYLLQFLVPVNICENTLRRGFAPNKQAGERRT
jgi:RHH-type proline utilization regulon transcriptional repressor/proline dehydrogenase/delta 1-pyrroline-5-carboxylate dehydrogenase